MSNHVFSSSSSTYSCVIIGASLAGATAAHLLGEKGIDTAIIEPQALPRIKACGEGLSSIGKNYLEAIGLWSKEISTASYPYYGYSVNFIDRSKFVINSESDEIPLGYGVSRKVMNASIYQTAINHPWVKAINDRVITVKRTGETWQIS